MDESFTRKVRAAALAGWWAILIAYCILLIQWLVYVAIVPRQPTGGAWFDIATVWLWPLVPFKFILGAMIFVVIWLTLWWRQLMKR